MTTATSTYLLNRAAQRYGVPASIIASIIGVETLYGRNV
ncbi:lytic murein transglycosylase, partial [Bordetella pertussis]